jgi:hypothetical protein
VKPMETLEGAAYRKRYFSLLLLVLIGSGVLAFGMLTNGHDWGDDFASYIMQARSICEWNMQDFIKHNSFTIQNSDFPIGPIAYSWGYPLLLAPIYKFSGMNLYGFKFLNIALYLSFLICLYFLLSQNRLSPLEGLLLIAVFAFNPEILRFQDNILSDTAFLFFSTLSLLLIDRFVVHKDGPTIGRASSIGLAVFAAYFVRSNGLVLLLSLFFWQVIQLWRNRKEYLNKRINLNFIAVYLTFALFWFCSSLLFPNGQGSYLSQYGLLDLDGLKKSIIYYLQVWETFFSSIPAANFLSKIFIAFFLISFVSSPPRDLFLKLYFALTLTVFVLYPLPQGLRYLFPILPIFIYQTYIGMTWTASKIAKARPAARWLARSFWIGMIIIFLWTSIGLAKTNLRSNRERGGPFDRESLEMYRFVKEKTPKSSVILFFKPRLLRMMTDRDSVMVNQCGKLKLGDYIVLDLSGDAAPGEYAEQLSMLDLENCNIPLNLVFHGPKFSTYEILKSQSSTH